MEYDKKKLLEVYEYAISELISASFQSDSKRNTFEMLTSSTFKCVFRVITLLLFFSIYQTSTPSEITA